MTDHIEDRLLTTAERATSKDDRGWAGMDWRDIRPYQEEVNSERAARVVAAMCRVVAAGRELNYVVGRDGIPDSYAVAFDAALAALDAMEEKA